MKTLTKQQKIERALKNLLYECQWVDKSSFTQTGKTAFQQALNKAAKALNTQTT